MLGIEYSLICFYPGFCLSVSKSSERRATILKFGTIENKQKHEC